MSGAESFGSPLAGVCYMREASHQIWQCCIFPIQRHLRCCGSMERCCGASNCVDTAASPRNQNAAGTVGVGSLDQVSTFQVRDSNVYFLATSGALPIVADFLISQTLFQTFS